MFKKKANYEKILVLYYILFIHFLAEELPPCEWNNSTGKPCLTIFSAPNTSSISETGLGKIVITKQQIIDSGYEDVRSVLESIVGWMFIAMVKRTKNFRFYVNKFKSYFSSFKWNSN